MLAAGSLGMSESRHLATAESNFKSAYLSLQKALPKEIETSLSEAKFPDCSTITNVTTTSAEIETTLDKFIEVRNVTEDTKSRTRIIKEIIGKWFRASYPFAQTFLSLGVTGSSVGRTLF
jgi:hypothetical protein